VDVVLGLPGKTGRAITLVAPVDELQMRAIERLTGQAVKRVMLSGFGGTPAAFGAAGRAASKVQVKSAGGRRSFRPRRAVRRA
jgi:superfamily II DNA/RNA helicase